MTPAQAQVRLQNGVNHLRGGDLAGAEKEFRAVLKADKRNFPALNLLSVVLMQQKRFADAEPYLKAASAINGASASTVYNYGLVLNELERPKEALAQFDKALALASNDAEAWNSRGLALKALSRIDEAIESFDKAASLRPDYADVYFNKGNALKEAKRPEQALASYDRAIDLTPGHVATHKNRSNMLYDLDRREEALAGMGKALALDPRDAEAHYNFGCMSAGAERYDEALASFDRAIALKADYASVYHRRGSLLSARQFYDDAIADLRKAIELNPANTDAYFDLGNALQHRGRYHEAADIYEKAAVLDPKRPEAINQALHSRMQECSWAGYDGEVQKILRSEPSKDLPLSPFPLLAIPAPLDLRRRAAESYAASQFPQEPQFLWNGEIYGHSRPRIGYFSSDFRTHPVAFLMAELFERHDRSRVEVVGFALDPEIKDPMRHRIGKAFDQFHEVSDKTNLEIAKLARSLEIDVAVDLNAFTAGGRPGIFAHRFAPIQASYLGFAGTMGASYIDYVVADPVVVPCEHFDGYVEKVVQLPHTFQVNDSKRAIADEVPPRSALGLPEDGFVFCCFNNSYKLTPDVFGIWMRLLTKTPGSVLWMRQDNPAVRANLIAEAKKRGVAAERLVFASRTSTMADHLARQKRADLFVDTFYYNAHTTASDALWAGLPVATCIGDTYASRVAASLLMALDMPELIAKSHSEYEELILSLAANPARLAEIRAKLERNIKTKPLFDIGLFTRHIEDAYLAMWQRTCDGLPPDHIAVAP